MAIKGSFGGRRKLSNPGERLLWASITPKGRVARASVTSRHRPRTHTLGVLVHTAHFVVTTVVGLGLDKTTMWCTRWYLPLLLLPFPIAPPFYLLLWVFSISLHARPCFYCMALLSTMYVSLCYWPPVPIDTPLLRPWSENITTFADAVLSRMPDLPPEKVPRMMPIDEHCWCDLSSGVFSPVNLTKWEESSVNRVVEVLEKHQADLREMERREQCEAEAAGTKGNVRRHSLARRTIDHPNVTRDRGRKEIEEMISSQDALFPLELLERA
ncbi:hypothetical protein NUW54_g11449 [Trametes sanguinea]|uniref:Uncharacterized protein n=1 Tax=Trametes sanguinea TaxID=158606 RepID=A0ACC1NFJ7_9APHY|nr:hypothetical protein NUW54_g11449 [Trametes sanguinea]